MRGKRKSRVPLIEGNFRAKLLRRHIDSDQSAAVHPGSVNAALSAFTSPSLPSLSLTSFKAAHKAHIKAVMENISSHWERWSGPTLSQGKGVTKWAGILESPSQRRKW